MIRCIAGCQYMPSAEFFARWIQHGSITIESKEHFQKRSWRNKTAIQNTNGLLYLSVPLKKGKHDHKPIQEVEIAYDEPWNRNHVHNIATAYGKTSFYNEMEGDLRSILFEKRETLWNLNLALIHYFSSLIPGDWKLSFTNEYIDTYPASVCDLRRGMPAGASLSSVIIPLYDQVHRAGKPHSPNLSILDALCHLGPETRGYLEEYSKRLQEASC